MVYHLEDFEQFTPQRQTLAVFGNPVAHSLSPALHQEFGRESGVDFDYIALEVTEEEFPRALELARQKLCGFNLTMPFKQLILPYLSELSDAVRSSGSANTVSVINGKFYGFTTDGAGLCAALLCMIPTLSGQRVLILGAGGAARSITDELLKANASVTIAARNSEKSAAFAADFKGAVSCVPFDAIPDAFDVLINATPIGMRMSDSAPVNLFNLTELRCVYDCIYNPPMTPLLRDAQKRRLLWDNGLSMLVLQGAFSQMHWFHTAFSDDMIEQTITTLRAQQALRRLHEVHGKTNIALTGFMGCGKTTIGKRLAQLLHMNFVDLDAKIEAEQRMKITEIFDKRGEEYFRELETRACEDCRNLKNTVISTGGGTVIRFDNDKILKEDALIVFLNRTFAEIERNLEHSTNRPLLQVNNVREHIRSLYEFRQPQYLERADISVEFSSDDVEDAVQHVLLYL